MTPYHAQHADLFRAVAEILVRDYQAQSETSETVEEWCEWADGIVIVGSMSIDYMLTMEPSELAALIAGVEGYEKR